jgi:MFS family permease
MTNASSSVLRPSLSNVTPFYASTMVTFLAASSAPTPLYRLYQEQWGVSPPTLTMIFSAYVVSLLFALLTAGRLSDYVGRRPVIFGALLLDSVALAMFAGAQSAGMLILARAVQGLASGAATTAMAAAMLDGDKHRGPLINGLSPMIGMAAGSVASGALAAYAPWPLHLVYLLLIVVMLTQAALIWTLPETAEVRPGALASLRPRLAVPQKAKRLLALLVPSIIAVWGLGGFYLSLMPSLMRTVTGVETPLLGGIVVSVLMLSGGASIFALQHRAGRSILSIGMSLMLVGVGTLLYGVEDRSTVIMAAGSAVTGLGFGAGFLGGLRLLMPLAEPNERAALMAVFYLISYLAFCLPAIAAGFLAQALGLVGAIQIYGGAVMALAATALLVTRLMR